MTHEEDLYHELIAYTLQLRDDEFIHQHVVDAYVAQHAGPESKPMSVVFALVGLYLYLEKGHTGRQVQRAHTEMAQQRKSWVLPQLPSELSRVTVREIMSQPCGAARNALIRCWCEEVWQSWRHGHDVIATISRETLHV